MAANSLASGNSGCSSILTPDARRHCRRRSMRRHSSSWFRSPRLAELGEILFPVLAGRTAACGAAGGFGSAQFDAADLARDGLRQLGEFEAADTFVGCQMLADMAKDGNRGVAVRQSVGGQC